VYENMFKEVEGQTANRSELFERLEAQEQQDVTEYLAWLPSQGLKQNTINSYKTYICKAILKSRGDVEGDPTSDEKSAVKKFKVWHSVARAAEAPEGADEEADDEG
jgi:hypothetical protein